MHNILITGGSGTLGKQLKECISYAISPSHAELDITNFNAIDTYFKSHSFNTVIHAAAFVSPPKIDNNPLLALETNIMGVVNIVKVCMLYGKRLIYISTDYVFNGQKGNYKEEDPVFPVNKYAWSKLGGECAVRLMDNYLIIRTSFGPDIFPYEAAFIDQWTSRETVSTIAKKIAKIVPMNVVGTVHIGGKKKSVFEYAKKITNNRQIKSISRKNVKFMIPKDTSLSTNKYHSLINDSNE